MFGKKDKAPKAKKPKKGKKGEAEAAAPEGESTPAAEGEAAAEGAEGEAAPKKKGLPIKLMAMGLAVLLVLGGGGGAGAYFMVIKPKQDAAHAADGGKDAHAKDKKKDKKKGKKKEGEKGKEGGEGGKGAGPIKEGPDGVFFYSMPTFKVNMQNADGRPTFMQLDIVLEISDEEIGANIDEQMPRVQDVLQTFLRELRPEDLQGSQGTFRLRQEMQRRLNLMIAPAKVNTVLIQNLLIT